MTDPLQTVRDDISFLKSLAIEGQSPVRFGGSILVAAGSIFGAASLVHGALAAAAPTPWIFPLLWGAATVGFLATLAVLKRQLSPGPTGAGRAAASAWRGVGWAIFTLATCMAIVAWRTQSAAPLQLFPSIILALYGMAWSAVGATVRLRWVGAAAVGSFVAAGLTALVGDGPGLFVMFAAALAALAIAPGLALIRLAKANA